MRRCFPLQSPEASCGRKIFTELVEKYARRGSQILETGAGPTNKTTEFLSTLGRVTGLDIDEAVKANIHCKHVLIYDGSEIPCADSSFDLVVSNYVFEHVEYPLVMCREIHRVLRPGGVFVFRTPNLWHYVSLIARLTPHRFHMLVANKLRRLQKGGHDPYPTFHRMNTRRVCLRALGAANFDVRVCQVIEKEPSYGMVSRLIFYPLMMWERILNSSNVFEGLRANILCVAFAKKGQTKDG